MTQSKFNPNKNGNAQNKPHHYKMNFDEKGNYLVYGNGCKVCPNCFECPPQYEYNCQYGNNVITVKEGGQRELSMG